MKIVLDACPELLGTIEKAATEDALIVRYVLEYASSLSKSRYDSEAQFIVFIVASTARSQPELARSIAAAVEDRAAIDDRLRGNLRQLFEPVTEGQTTVLNWQSGLREVLSAGSFYVFDVATFADRIRRAAGQRSKMRFLMGFREFLRKKSVSYQKERTILKRVGLLLLPLGVLATSNASAQELPQTRSAPRLGYLSVLCLAAASIVTFVGIRHCTEMDSFDGSSGAASTSDPAVSSSPPRLVVSNTPIAIADAAGLGQGECSTIPNGPSRKDCLIQVADRNRDQFERAEHFYKLAIADGYDISPSHKQTVSPYWRHGVHWSNQAVGKELSTLQDLNALVALTTLYSRAGRHAQAAETWRKVASMPINRGMFGDGLGKCGAYVWDVLNRKAGLLEEKVRRGGAGMGCYWQISFEEALHDSPRVYPTEGLKLYSRALYHLHSALADDPPLWTRIDQDPIWAGILPTPTDMIAQAQAEVRALMAPLAARKLAVDFNEAGIFLSPTGALTVAVFPDESRYCPDWSSPIGNHGSVSLMINVEVGGTKIDIQPNEAGVTYAEIPIVHAANGTSVVAWVVGHSPNQEGWFECGSRKRFEAFICRDGDALNLSPKSQGCN